MNIGMLWYDNDKKTGLSTKIQRAASYYQTKYGAYPNVCFVHPCMIELSNVEGEKERINSPEIKIRTSASVLPNHFWIGVNGSAEKSLT